MTILKNIEVSDRRGKMLMDTSVINLFSTCLHKYILPTSLIDDCKEELVSYAQNNESGIQQYFTTYNTHLETVDSIGPSCKIISNNVVRFATKMAERRARIENSFFNYVPKGNVHSKHNHGGKEMICAIVYFDNIGQTNFYDPRPQVFNWQPHSEVAEKGKVVLFPGWLEHDMPAHYEDEYRITMPFNMLIDTIER